MDNAEINKYKNQLRGRIEMLRLQCEEMELTMHFADLEVLHREKFPEYYRSKEVAKQRADYGNQPSTNETGGNSEVNPTDVSEERSDSGIAERSNQSE